MNLKDELEMGADIVRLKTILEEAIQYVIPDTMVIETVPKKQGRIKITFEAEK